MCIVCTPKSPEKAVSQTHVCPPSPGQLISDQLAEIISKYDPNVYSIKYNNQLATRAAQAIFDDSYLGK